MRVYEAHMRVYEGIWGPYHTSYLSHSSHVRHVEKNLSCGEISDFYTWQMGRNLKNVEEFQIPDVENCKILTIVEKFLISPHDICEKLKFTLFCCKISWLAVYAVLLQNLFCRDFCVEKIFSQKCGEKITNMMYGLVLEYSSSSIISCPWCWWQTV